MRMMPLFFALFAVALVDAGAKPKQQPLTIRFHAEGKEDTSGKFTVPITLTIPPKKTFIEKIPIVSERDLSAFVSFPGTTGGYGVYLRFDTHGTNIIEQFTMSRQGELAIALVNGRVVAALKVDKPIHDGILVIPGGLTPEEVAALARDYPQIGRESEFKKQSGGFLGLGGKSKEAP